MLTKVYGKFVCQCDCCDETLDLDTKDFGEAQEGITAADWKKKKEGVDWEHFCTNCQE